MDRISPLCSFPSTVMAASARALSWSFRRAMALSAEMRLASVAAVARRRCFLEKYAARTCLRVTRVFMKG